VLERWEVIKVFRPDLHQPHDKFCICISWEKRWFLYINSAPPVARKARELAVRVESYEIHFLIKASYIDTVSFIDDVPEDHIEVALKQKERCLGALPPFVVQRIKREVLSNKSLNDEKKRAVFN